MKKSSLILMVVCIIIGIISFISMFNYFNCSIAVDKNSDSLLNISRNTKSENIQTDIPVAQVNKSTVTEETIFVFKTTDNKGILEQKKFTTPPTSLIGKTKDDVKSYYNDWQLDKFSTKTVELTRTAKQDDIYIIGVSNGYITVFNNRQINGTYIYMVTDKPVSTLSFEQQQLLDDGIFVKGHNELIRILEDYTS